MADFSRSSSLEESLSALPASVRARVEESLKATLERELAKYAVTDPGAVTLPGAGGQAAAFDRQHDRGPLFGRDFDRQSRDLAEILEISNLDDAAFTKFAERLAVLRRPVFEQRLDTKR